MTAAEQRRFERLMRLRKDFRKVMGERDQLRRELERSQSLAVKIAAIAEELVELLDAELIASIGGAASRARDTSVLLEGLPWLCPNCEKVTNEPYRDTCKLCHAPRPT